ncbi:hypothetical protein D3C86_2071050 [compost metagenome]
MQLIEQIRGDVFAIDDRLGLHIQHMHLELRKVLGKVDQILNGTFGTCRTVEGNQYRVHDDS